MITLHQHDELANHKGSFDIIVINIKEIGRICSQALPDPKRDPAMPGAGPRYLHILFNVC